MRRAVEAERTSENGIRCACGCRLHFETEGGRAYEVCYDCNHRAPVSIVATPSGKPKGNTMRGKYARVRRG